MIIDRKIIRKWRQEMPELPEIYNLAAQMNKELKGKKIADVEILQEKCLNVPADTFKSLVTGKTIATVIAKGKWVIVKLEPGAYFLLSLGMGGDVLYQKPGDTMPEKYRLKLDFEDNSALSINFWWFGYAHAVPAKELSSHKMTATLGVVPLDENEFTFYRFAELVKSSRKSIKSILLDQKLIAGIGNVYVQDILFKASLHPDRKASQLSEDEIEKLYDAISGNLKAAVEMRGLKFERDLYGQPGELDQSKFLVGYKEGQPCPKCGTIIEKIKTGSTASYICPACQRMQSI